MEQETGFPDKGKLVYIRISGSDSGYYEKFYPAE
jgi:hypothetical protein